MESKFLEGLLATEHGPKAVRIEFAEQITSITEIQTSSDLPTISSGLVDTHTHGLLGTPVSGDPAELSAITASAARFGVTRTVLSLVSSPIDEMVAVLDAANAVPEDSGLIGIHLEGPYLAQSRCGAHAMNELRRLTTSELERLLTHRALESITIAPEQVSVEQTTELAKQCLVALGHTDADYELSMQHFQAGASILTHALNAMPQLTSRQPGPLGAAIKAGATVEIIADGHHLHPATVKALFKMADNPILVTDSIAAAGLGDTTLRLGEVSVTVSDGVARRDDNGALAGSTLTLNRAVQNCVEWGISEVVAFEAASSRPAELFGLKNHSVAVGSRADLVLWDNYQALSVYRDGRLVHGSAVN